MQKIVSLRCPKCNNSHSFYRFGKNPQGFQKYQCRSCYHQFAPDRPSPIRKHPGCPVCGRASFLHHDHTHYSNYRCTHKACNHSFFVVKHQTVASPSMSALFGKSNFKRMRYPVHLIITALSMFYLGKNSYRNIALILQVAFNVSVTHTTVGNWCRNFAPLFDSFRLTLLPILNFDSDEWHTDETVIKINGRKFYIWFIIDSETRFVLGFHLSPHRNSPQAFSLLHSVRPLGSPGAIVSDRYSAYKVPVQIGRASCRERV